jgi:hypothetical protein
MGNENIKTFVVKHSSVYGIVVLIYLGLAIRYVIYLWTFNCDGFGCLSILFFTGPLTLLFIANFSSTIFRLLRMKLTKKHEEQNERAAKFKSGLAISFVLLTLFTFLMILRLT